MEQDNLSSTLPKPKVSLKETLFIRLLLLLTLVLLKPSLLMIIIIINGVIIIHNMSIDLRKKTITPARNTIINHLTITMLIVLLYYLMLISYSILGNSGVIATIVIFGIVMFMFSIRLYFERTRWVKELMKNWEEKENDETKNK